MNDSNRRIVLNSLILYVRLIVTGLLGLIVTRLILKNLGIDDFGIYAVIGGLVTMMAFVNTVMLAATNRFIAFEIGKKSIGGVNRVFNSSLVIHTLIAVVVVLIAVSAGKWYIVHYINVPEVKLNLVLSVFYWSVCGAVVSFLGVPFNGLLLAKEKFVVFCMTDIVASLCKLGLAAILACVAEGRLLIYAAGMAVITAFPTLVYAVYCNKKFPELVRFNISRRWVDYKVMLGFSVWTGYGALATVGKVQGAALLVNYFFSVALNAALGIANSVNAIILMFSNNVGRAITPQITKSYAAGDRVRMEELVIASSKYTFFLMLLPAVPLLLETDVILGVWLTEVPPYTATFIRLMLVDALIGALNAGIPEAIFATGHIKWYQITVNTVFLFSLVLAYLFLRAGADPSYLFYSYIFISIVVLIIRQIFLQNMVKFINVRKILSGSYLPALVVCLLSMPLLLVKEYMPPVYLVPVSVLWVAACVYAAGLKPAEQIVVRKGIHLFINKLKL